MINNSAECFTENGILYSGHTNREALPERRWRCTYCMPNNRNTALLSCRNKIMLQPIPTALWVPKRSVPYNRVFILGYENKYRAKQLYELSALQSLQDGRWVAGRGSCLGRLRCALAEQPFPSVPSRPLPPMPRKCRGTICAPGGKKLLLEYPASWYIYIFTNSPSISHAHRL